MNLNVSKNITGQKAQLIKDLPVTIVKCTLHKDDCHCDWCKTELRPIGREYVRKQSNLSLLNYVYIRSITILMNDRPCKSSGADMIVKAETP